MQRLNLRHVNNVLGGIVVVLAIYVLLLPFLPELGLRVWRVTKRVPPLVAANQPDRSGHTNEQLPKDNTLVIPKILLQQTIYEGQKPYPALNKGVWRYPGGSAPDKASNTVLSGHRFTYGGPAVFYHLDKLAPGDDIIIYWLQKKYSYRVEEVRVVPPTAAEIQQPTDDTRLTIYTCTPLVTAQNRLVIRAKPVTESAPL